MQERYLRIKMLQYLLSQQQHPIHTLPHSTQPHKKTQDADNADIHSELS